MGKLDLAWPGTDFGKRRGSFGIAEEGEYGIEYIIASDENGFRFEIK